MGADNISLFLLLPLTIGIIIAFMKSWLICFGAVFLTMATGLFIAGILNDRPILLYASIVPFVFGIAFLLESGRRVLKQQRVTGGLSKLRETGVDFLNQGLEIRSDADKDNWWKGIIIWRDDVCAKMFGVSSVDSKNWRLLGTYGLKIFTPTPYSRDMNDKLTQLSVLLEKLEHYIDTK